MFFKYLQCDYSNNLKNVLAKNITLMVTHFFEFNLPHVLLTFLTFYAIIVKACTQF